VKGKNKLASSPEKSSRENSSIRDRTPTIPKLEIKPVFEKPIINE
jgi:hypothetical protein